MASIEVTAKTVEEAVALAKSQIAEMGATLLDTEVLEEPSNGMFGLFKKDAKIRAHYEVATEMDTESLVEAEERLVETVTKAIEEEVAESTEEEAEVVETALTPAKQGEIADKAKAFLQAMFEKMGLAVMIEKRITDERIVFQIYGENLGLLIGKHGQTLDAIQYLTNLVANKGEQHCCQIMVDVEDYRSRREKTLQQLAKRLADKARRNRQRVPLEPMNAYERKIIHTALQDTPHITTTSEGEGPFRHVVIEYVR